MTMTKTITSILDENEKKILLIDFFKHYSFFVELFAIASIPLLATAFLDPDILVNKMPYLKNLIIKDNILIILSSAVCVTFSIKALFYIWLIYFQEKILQKNQNFNFYKNFQFLSQK